MVCTKDFLGNFVEVGDTVAFVTPRYHQLSKGQVVRITDCGVRVTNKRYSLLVRSNNQFVLAEKGGE